MNLINIANMVLNRPVLLEPAYAGFFYNYLSQRFNAQSLTLANGEQLADAEMIGFNKNFVGRSGDKLYPEHEGMAIIPIAGTLTHRFGALNPQSGMTGYDGIELKLDEALADNDIKGILLDIDSPGGSVAGCFDLAKKIHAANKPVWAVVDENACSAAYTLASAADKIIVTDTAQVGSVGVLMAHTDVSKRLEKDGLNITLIHAGDHKVDGNPYEALSKSVKADIQAEIDSVYDKFTALVAKHRNMDVSAVVDTQARIYSGQEAVGIGFADAVMPANQAVKEFINYLSAEDGNNGGLYMSEKEKPQSAAEVALTSADLQQAKADATANERERIAAILDAEQAEGREQLARHFALKTDMHVDAALSALDASPKASSDEPNLMGLEIGAKVEDEAERAEMSDFDKDLQLVAKRAGVRNAS